MKCKYKYCKHGGTVDKVEAIKDGSSYYHKECYEEKNIKQDIKKLYKKYYSSKESDVIINKVINQIIHDKCFDAEYVLFALCQAIRNKDKMNNVMAMHYIVNNKDYVSKYNKRKAIREVKKITFNNVDTVTNDIIKYNKIHKKTWTDTLFK